jgi:RNA polymerase sigma-70 factor (ECF subfamily)
VTRRVSEEISAEITQLFLKTAADLHAYARTLPGVEEHAADDLVQEAFKAAAVKWGDLARRDTEGQRCWLFTVVRYKAIDQWRRNRKCVPIPEPPEVPSAVDTTADRVISVMALKKCWSVVRAMPPVRQQVAYLRWGEDWTSEDIATLLGVEQSTVRGHLKKALDELRDQAGVDVPFIRDPEIDEGG